MADQTRDNGGRKGASRAGTCASCRLVQARSHPDLLVLVPEAQQAADGALMLRFRPWLVLPIREVPVPREGLVGQAGTPELGARALQLTGARAPLAKTASVQRTKAS